jgi:hypothetical protein
MTGNATPIRQPARPRETGQPPAGAPCCCTLTTPPREHRPLPRAAQRHRAAGPEHFQRPQDAECVRTSPAGRLFRNHHTSARSPAFLASAMLSA